MTELFMQEVRNQIGRREMMTPLSKVKLWEAIKESRFPIVMGAMAIAEGSIDFACGSMPYVWLSVFRTATFFEMSREGAARGRGKVRQSIVEEQYNEVADEI
jgi:hypothetical protein